MGAGRENFKDGEEYIRVPMTVMEVVGVLVPSFLSLIVHAFMHFCVFWVLHFKRR